MQTIIFNINGMTCGGCVKSVSSVLENIPGVTQLDVSLAQNQATITYDAALAKPQQFKSAIEDAGFDVVE